MEQRVLLRGQQAALHGIVPDEKSFMMFFVQK
jgi:hypothetical protein